MQPPHPFPSTALLLSSAPSLLLLLTSSPSLSLSSFHPLFNPPPPSPASSSPPFHPTIPPSSFPPDLQTSPQTPLTPPPHPSYHQYPPVRSPLLYISNQPSADIIAIAFLLPPSPRQQHKKNHLPSYSPSTPSGGPPHVQRLGLLSRWSRASPPPPLPPPPPPRLSAPPALRRTRASSLSCSLRSETGKKRHSLTEPSLRRRVPGDALGDSCAMVTACNRSGLAPPSS